VEVVTLDLRSCSRRAHQEYMPLVGNSTAAPGIAVPLRCIKNALKAKWGRGGSSLIVVVGLKHKQ
jgi:hypothetical protein